MLKSWNDVDPPTVEKVFPGRERHGRRIGDIPWPFEHLAAGIRSMFSEEA
jgi:hypothetical protein